MIVRFDSIVGFRHVHYGYTWDYTVIWLNHIKQWIHWPPPQTKILATPLGQGSANVLSRGPINEMMSLGGPQLLSQEKRSAHFNIVLSYYYYYWIKTASEQIWTTIICNQNLNVDWLTQWFNTLWRSRKFALIFFCWHGHAGYSKRCCGPNVARGPGFADRWCRSRRDLVSGAQQRFHTRHIIIFIVLVSDWLIRRFWRTMSALDGTIDSPNFDTC